MELTPAAALAAAAARQGWSGDELADRIQVSRSLVATWLDGSAEPPERFHRRLLETLDFTDEECAALTGTEPPAPDDTEPPAPDDTEPPAPNETEPPAPNETEPPAPNETEPPAPDETARASRRSVSMTAGRAIQEARRRKGWTTRELASAIHYERGEIESWEDDVAEPWSFAIRQMMEVLDFTSEEAEAVRQAEA